MLQISLQVPHYWLLWMLRAVSMSCSSRHAKVLMLLGRAQQFINNNQRSRTTVWSFGSGGMAIMDLALFPHVGSVCHPTHTHLISHDLARSIIKRHYNMHAFRTKSNRAYWTTEAWRYRVIISTQRLNRITYNHSVYGLTNFYSSNSQNITTGIQELHLFGKKKEFRSC